MCRILVTAALLLSLHSIAEAATRTRGEAGATPKNRISSSQNTTCMVLDDGTVRCWGANEQGQTGNGALSASVSTPAAVPNVTGIIGIAAGRDHTCALAALATVRCWGDNSSGQLGNGSLGGRSTSSVTVAGLDKVTAIAAGDGFTCALRVDGTVRCWGDGSSGQLGHGPASGSATPVTASGLTNAVAITAGSRHACALMADGTARCWGSGGSGQLGTGGGGDRFTPGFVSGLTGAIQVSAGSFHTCALLADGTAKCWGRNQEGQVGDGVSSAPRNVPTAVSQLTQATAIAGGNSHTCAIRSDGTMRCWGLNTSGQLGDGTINFHLDAGTAVVGISNAVELTAGFVHTCAVDVSGAPRCWGGNAVGQLGNGTTNPSNVPNSVPVTVTGIAGTVSGRAIVAGFGFTCARRGNGTAACWGKDNSGELGDSSAFESSADPGPVFETADVLALAAGEDHACALRSTGNILCWGNNSAGQLGDGDLTSQGLPNTVLGITQQAVGIAAGSRHTCAVMTDGTARCWGANTFGQLGNNSFSNTTAPVVVEGLTNATAIAAGGSHTCALVADGTVSCWGRNASGQLGTGTNTDVIAPRAVSGLSNVVALAAGTDHTCAVLASGSVRCWGENQFGQLGNSVNQDRNIPDTVAGLADAKSITAGRSHSCAVLADGGVACWGRNADGQLAAEDNADHNTPTNVIQSFASVGGSTVPFRIRNVVAITAGFGFDGAAHTCSLQAQGLPRCWGDNSQGQIGNGTTADTPRPTPVPSFSANVDPDVTLKSNGRIAEVTGLLNCDPGSHGQIFVTLVQGTVVGYGVASTNCSGGLLEVPLNVPAHGRTGFQPGEAIADLEAVVRENGQVTQHLFWTVAVTIAP